MMYLEMVSVVIFSFTITVRTNVRVVLFLRFVLSLAVIRKVH